MQNRETHQTYYYHRDHQGSIIALTNEAGQIVERITYADPFGNIMEHTQHEVTHNPYGYTGREMDTLRLYYYRARYYSPILRRFLSPDPIEHASGDFNWYRYVGNDPVNFVDPTGLWPWDSNESMSAEDAKDAIDKTKGYGKIFDIPGHDVGKKGVDILSKESCKKYNAIKDLVGKDKANKMFPCIPKPKSSDVANKASVKAKKKAAHKYYCDCASGPGAMSDKICTAALKTENWYDGTSFDKNCTR